MHNETCNNNVVLEEINIHDEEIWTVVSGIDNRGSDQNMANF